VLPNFRTVGRRSTWACCIVKNIQRRSGNAEEILLNSIIATINKNLPLINVRRDSCDSWNNWIRGRWSTWGCRIKNIQRRSGDAEERLSIMCIATINKNLPLINVRCDSCDSWNSWIHGRWSTWGCRIKNIQRRSGDAEERLSKSITCIITINKNLPLIDVRCYSCDSWSNWIGGGRST
jgi:hypothetical protein